MNFMKGSLFHRSTEPVSYTHLDVYKRQDMDLADYGKELAMRDGIYPKDELLAACFDAEGYANQRMKRMGLSAAEHGLSLIHI